MIMCKRGLNRHLASASAVLIAAGGLMLGAGCAPSVARRDVMDRQHPQFQRAMADKNSGNVEGAIRRLRHIVLEHPSVALAHLELALLLHDRQQAHVEAIYHYQAYLRWRPESEKDAMIRDRIRDAERMLVARLDRTAERTEDLRRGEEQIRGLTRQLEQSEAIRNRTQDRNRELEARIAELQRENQRLRERVEFLLQAPSPPPPDRARAREVETFSGGPPRARLYEVQSNDTLTGIATLIYGDPAHWTRIRDANRVTAGAVERLTPGLELVIP